METLYLKNSNTFLSSWSREMEAGREERWIKERRKKKG